MNATFSIEQDEVDALLQFLDNDWDGEKTIALVMDSIQNRLILRSTLCDLNAQTKKRHQGVF